MKYTLRGVLAIGLGAVMQLVSFRAMWYLTAWSLGAVIFASLLIYIIGIFLGLALISLTRPKRHKRGRRGHGSTHLINGGKNGQKET